MPRLHAPFSLLFLSPRRIQVTGILPLRPFLDPAQHASRHDELHRTEGIPEPALLRIQRTQHQPRRTIRSTYQVELPDIHPGAVFIMTDDDGAVGVDGGYLIRWRAKIPRAHLHQVAYR